MQGGEDEKEKRKNDVLDRERLNRCSGYNQ